jgi:hypothetical protein
MVSPNNERSVLPTLPCAKAARRRKERADGEEDDRRGSSSQALSSGNGPVSESGMADYHKASGGGGLFPLSNLRIRATQASCDTNASLSIEDRSHSPVNQPPQTLVSNS